MVSQSTTCNPRSIADGSAQYLHRYAEPESSLAALCPHAYDFVMVVPAYAESPSFVDGYRAAAMDAGRVLVIVVLNGRTGAAAAVHASNLQCLRGLSVRFSLQGVGRGVWLGHDADLSLLVLDRFTADHHFPVRQGVGLARKIGADVALELIARGQVSCPSIAMTDADARLPADYFARISELGADCSAAMFPFWHDADGGRDMGDMDRATALYEIRLRYVQRGLRWAHSPYAFHTVGSTMVVHALWYALVRGVPRRQAGEDFYLLGKLSKLHPLAYLRGQPVRLRSRLSDRVPFGTGSESAKLARGAAVELYHPDVFAAVRDVTHGLQRLSRDAGVSGHGTPGAAVRELLSRMRPPVKRFLEAQGASDAWRGISAGAPNPMARLRHLHDWFDGFRTLKLIHHLRDHESSSLPWQEAIRRAPFMDEVDDDGACLITARTALLRREQRAPRLVGPSVYQ